MRCTTISVMVFHLLALTLAAPAGIKPPKKESRDWMDDLGELMGARLPSPWTTTTLDPVFAGLAPHLSPPRRRGASPPNTQGGITSKIVKRNLIQLMFELLGMVAPSLPFGSSARNYQAAAASVMERISLLKDPLLEHLREGSDELGTGIPLAKSKLLEAIMIIAVTTFKDKEALVTKEVGPNSLYTPRNLMDLLDRAKDAKVAIKGPVTCPDGTVFTQVDVVAAWELANLPEVMQNLPEVFPNTYTAGGKNELLFPDGADDLMQSPMVDELVQTGKLGKHSIIIDLKNSFVGVVQVDSDGVGFLKCNFK